MEKFAENNQETDNFYFEKETGISVGALKKINENPKLRKFFLTLIVSLGLVGQVAESKAQEIRVNPKNETEQEKNNSFLENFILRDDIRSWINFVKTGNFVKPEDHHYINLEHVKYLINKYSDSGSNYENGLDSVKQKHTEMNEIIDKNFLERTRSVSEDEVRKVYDYLQSKMNVWNLSDLSAFAADLNIAFDLKTKNDPRMSDGYYSIDQLSNFKVLADTYVLGDSGDKINENQQESNKDESALLYHSIKKILNSE